jgi:hypothetical protein
VLRRRPGRGLPVYQTCACGKVSAATLQIAKNLKREIAARTGMCNAVRYYTCRFGSVHWTSQTETETTNYQETA